MLFGLFGLLACAALAPVPHDWSSDGPFGSVHHLARRVARHLDIDQ